MNSQYFNHMYLRIKKLSEERGDITVGDDGYYVYWPKGYPAGYLDAESLRILAQILDDKNKEWDEELNTYFEQDRSGLNSEKGTEDNQGGA